MLVVCLMLGAWGLWCCLDGDPPEYHEGYEYDTVL